ncbi:MAG: aminopeptidase [Bacteroidetes bacterium]|nr:MAG: aminopeptidase [Bacteroidota bacterium]
MDVKVLVFGTFDLFWFDELVLKTEKEIDKFIKKTDQFKFIVVKEEDILKGEQRILLDAATRTYMARGVIIIREKLTWGVASKMGRYPIIEVLKNKIDRNAKKINIEMECLLIPRYESQNLIGYIPGAVADSFIVFTAHYDHLGRMGKETYFAGANDNASGTAMILDLARHYTNSADTPKYSIAIMAFAAEETGLRGSKYYTENPMFSLKKIKFLVNLDLMGNGTEGVTVVNGTEFKNEFETLVEINSRDSLLKEVKIRGKAQNSDHHFFTEKGVPCFFIYTRGGSKAYHDVYDTADNLALSEYNYVFRLLTEFVSTIH